MPISEKTKLQRKKYRLRNKEKIREYDRKYRLKNKEKIYLRYKAWREKNKESLRLKKSIYKYLNKDKAYASLKKWRNTKKGKEYSRKWLKDYRKKYPEKNKAHAIVQEALRKKEIIRKPCQKCGNKKSEAHHSDYSKPLKIKWLCRTCHMTIEKRRAICIQKGVIHA